MKIKLYYAEDHKLILFEINGQSRPAADLLLGLALVKKDMIREKFGPNLPTIEVCGYVDEKLLEAKKQFDDIFYDVFTQ